MLVVAVTLMVMVVVVVNYSSSPVAILSLVANGSPSRQITQETQPAQKNYMEQRMARVRQACESFKTDLLLQYAHMYGKTTWSALNESIWTNTNIVVDRKNHISWCINYKVASSSMVYALLSLVAEEARVEYKGTKPHIAIRKLMPKPSVEEDLAQYTRYMMVRHPFQRILSAYRCKFMDRDLKKQFEIFKKLYGDEIIKKYGVKERPEDYSDRPTFPEFVKYLVNTSPIRYNPHWLPYYLQCSPCHHNYNLIMKLETLEEDSQQLVNLTGLPQLEPKQVHKTMKTLVPLDVIEEENLDDKNQHLDGEVDNIEAAFYKQISIDDLYKLYESFKIDFYMYGYDISPYDSYVHN